MPKTEDQEIWAAYAKNVKPLGKVPRKKDNAAGKSRVPKISTIPKPASSISPFPRRDKSEPKPDLHMPLDRNVERRFRRGTMAIDARLDLHGLNQAQAHKALDGFIARQIKAGRRRLLVITGKGKSGTGILRAKLPDWLAASPLAAHILALRPASAGHGGEGAFYLLLRRKG